MRISKRLYKIAEQIKPGDTAADIGTDHGYVPMLLVRSGCCPRVIMSDISEDSLAKARETFRLCGLEADPSDFRVGDGLMTIAPAETDEVIIAGLGGHTIAGILETDISKSKSFSRLVLQPRKHSGSLRYSLYINGWDIEAETLAPEGKFVCEIISAVPTASPNRMPPYPEDDIRWKYPEAIVKADPQLAQKRISWKISSINEQIENLKRSGKDQSLLLQSLCRDLDYLQTLIR